MSLQSVAEEYFSKLNSMASRLHADMSETKLAYEELWSNLNYKEQEQILSESIIKPEICLKYSCDESEIVQENKYAMKVIVDDNVYYRDEHSAPFTFRTPSQRDLTVFSKCEEKPVVLPKVKKVGVSQENMQNVVMLMIFLQETEKPNIFHQQDDEPVSETNSTQFFPKTGLDLLDNW